MMRFQCVVVSDPFESLKKTHVEESRPMANVIDFAFYKKFRVILPYDTKKMRLLVCDKNLSSYAVRRRDRKVLSGLRQKMKIYDLVLTLAKKPYSQSQSK